MPRALSYALWFLVLMLVSGQAGAASQDVAANTEGFQKGEAFSVRKAMFSIFGNVDEQNRSTCDARLYITTVLSISFTTVEWKAFVLNNVETVYLVTNGVLLNLKGERFNPTAPAIIGLHVFEKRDDRWKLSASTKIGDSVGTTTRYEDVSFDFVKIGKDQMAFAINECLTDEFQSARFTHLYSPVDGKIKFMSTQDFYHDNLAKCSMKRGPGRVYDYLDLEGAPDKKALMHTCHRFKTEIYVFPSDSKFYTIRTITTDIIEWKGPDGKRLPPQRLEWDYRVSEDRLSHPDELAYERVLPAPATGPMVPLFDENANCQKWQQSLEKSPRGRCQ